MASAVLPLLPLQQRCLAPGRSSISSLSSCRPAPQPARPAVASAPSLLRRRRPQQGGVFLLPLVKPTPTVARAAAAGASGDDNVAGAATKTLGGISGRIRVLFSPFSDERCNKQLLALAVGQALCSIATLIHDSYLPVYVHDELGMSTTEIGAVQGIAQFLCQLAKGVSGVAGDVLGSQVRVLVFGTALTLACKPMFALLGGVHAALGVGAALWWFFAAKLLDRLSKGVREAPTKAVMNELAAKSGDAPDAAYGLRQSLATAGMLVGSTTAAATFALTGSNYTLTFALASIPTALALIWMVQNFRDELFEPRPSAASAASSPGAAPTSDASSAGSLSSSPLPGAGRSMSIGREATKPGALDLERMVQAASLSSADAGDVPSDLTRTSPLMPSNINNASAAAFAAAAGAAAAGRANGANANGGGDSVSVSVDGSEAVPEPKLSLLEKARVVLSSFKPVYWQALAVVAVLYFSRFDASFLSLRAKAVMPKAMLPLMTLLNSLIQVTLTAPLARWSGSSVSARNRLLLVGFGLMIGTHACYALPPFANTAGMFMGAALLGCHMAATHAITVSMVASYMPTGHMPGVGKLSGTAVSFTDLLLGFVLAASNAVAGMLTDATRVAGYGNTGCFAGGAVACVAAGLLLLVFERWGDLGRDDLVVGKAKRKKATA